LEGIAAHLTSFLQAYTTADIRKITFTTGHL